MFFVCYIVEEGGSYCTNMKLSRLTRVICTRYQPHKQLSKQDRFIKNKLKRNQRIYGDRTVYYVILYGVVFCVRGVGLMTLNQKFSRQFRFTQMFSRGKLFVLFFYSVVVFVHYSGCELRFHVHSYENIIAASEFSFMFFPHFISLSLLLIHSLTRLLSMRLLPPFECFNSLLFRVHSYKHFFLSLVSSTTLLCFIS